MSDQYVGEIRMFAGNYAPQGWAFCDGQILQIRENEALYTLIGTTYGGDGMTTFGLPDLRGRLPIHVGKNIKTGTTYEIGSSGGTETVTLTTNQLPTHTHVVNAVVDSGDAPSPSNEFWAGTNYSNFSDDKDASGNQLTPVSMNSATISSTGGGQPHENMMPSLTISFIIALEGIYPTQS